MVDSPSDSSFDESKYPDKKGIVKGVFGWPAIHVRDPKTEQNPSLKNIFIDVGCSSKKEVEAMGVHVGCVVTFEDELMELNKNILLEEH